MGGKEREGEGEKEERPSLQLKKGYMIPINQRSCVRKRSEGRSPVEFPLIPPSEALGPSSVCVSSRRTIHHAYFAQKQRHETRSLNLRCRDKLMFSTEERVEEKITLP
jgi:hypothetical protein